MAAIGGDLNRSMQHLDSHYREEDVENEVCDEDFARHLGLDSTTKRRKMAIRSGDMTKLQWSVQNRGLLSCKA